MRCPTCGTIGVGGTRCVVCDTRLPVQSATRGTPAPQPKKPHARPRTLGAFFASTSPAPLTRRQSSVPARQNRSQMPAAPKKQQQKQGWSPDPSPPQHEPQNWLPIPTAQQGPSQQATSFPSGAYPGYPGAQQAPSYSPFAPLSPARGLPQGQRSTPGLDVVDVSSGSSSLTRLPLNALVVCVVLALVGIPILFGLQRLSASNTAPITRTTATRVPTAVPPDGMVAFLGDHLSIAYPSPWTHRHQTQGTAYGLAQVDVFSQDAGTELEVFTMPSIPSDLLDTGIDSVSGSTLGGAIPQPTMTNKRVTYNSVQWVEDDFTVSLVVGDRETPEQMRVLGANEGLVTFVLVLVAPQSSFDATNTSTFEPMLRSLRLG